MRAKDEYSYNKDSGGFCNAPQRVNDWQFNKSRQFSRKNSMQHQTLDAYPFVGIAKVINTPVLPRQEIDDGNLIRGNYVQRMKSRNRSSLPERAGDIIAHCESLPPLQR